MTLTRAEMQRFHLQKWTAVAVENPCVVLVNCGRDLTIMLAKQHTSSDHEERFEGIQLISIPNGLRLRLLEIQSMFGAGRLPDEWLYMEAIIRRSTDGHQLFVDGFLKHAQPSAFAVKPLTGSQFQTLVLCRGRLLRAQVVAMFRQSLPSVVVDHKPWTRFSGWGTGTTALNSCG